MTDIVFREWPKIARLNRTCTITEKIDGTNGAVGITLVRREDFPEGATAWTAIDYPVESENMIYCVYAQSRTRIIDPENDNFGFAKWVRANADGLISVLGEGLHYGEWWGSGIQRGYGLEKGEKRFSLFNTKRWTPNGENALADGSEMVPGLGVVPVLYEGIFDTAASRETLALLEREGSFVAPGFMKPEGIVIYHHAANICFKVTLEKDEEPKGKSR